MTPASMSARNSLAHAIRLLALAAAFSISTAYADDYSDVNRLIHSGQLGEAMSKVEQYLATKPRDPIRRDARKR